jgi:hypothetical protein
MNITFIGIDPGVTGAVSFVYRHSAHKSMVQPLGVIFDLPVTQYTYLANQSKSLNIPEFSELLQENIGSPDYVVLATEQMQGMGFKTPAKTLTMLAEMAGSIEAVVRMTCLRNNIPLFIRKYQPKTWTHWMFPDSDFRSSRKTEAKNESLEKARELFPTLDEFLNLKKHHDRAEALLLAFVAIAELQGCVIDPKLKKMGDLANVYLIHKQDAKKQEAKFSDIWQADIIQNDTLKKEINLRK